MAATSSINPTDSTSDELKLLLHCVDGAIPYLTPYLLEHCFPAHQVDDILMLGLAVRDTCITPTFRAENHESKKKKKSNKKNSKAPNSNDTNQESNHNNNSNNNGSAKQPNGYTFSTDITPDSWLLKYRRITVPTFDPYYDALKFSPKHVADTTTLTSSSNAIMVWTGNGRQSLSLDLYHQGALSLGCCNSFSTKSNNTNISQLKSHATVSLFDFSLPTFPVKRRKVALERTNDWRQQLIKFMQEQQSEEESSVDGTSSSINNIWASCLLSPISEQRKPSPVEEEDVRVEKEQFLSLEMALTQQTIQGVALVGWQYSGSLEQQEALLRSAISRLVKSPNEQIAQATLTVLSTNSLRQLLICYQVGINVVGTNLPAIWAKEKLAFAIEYNSFVFTSTDGTSDKEPNTNKRPKLDTNTAALNGDGCVSVLEDGEIPNKDSIADGITSQSWIRDDRPILPGCSCLTCQKHCRAYLYHLAMTKELLVEILLFIHNLHHLVGLCRVIADARKKSNQDDVLQHLRSQLGC